MITYPGRRIFRVAGEPLAWRLEERVTLDVSVSTGSLPRSHRLGKQILSHIVKIKLKYHMKIPLASFPVSRLYFPRILCAKLKFSATQTYRLKFDYEGKRGSFSSI